MVRQADTWRDGLPTSIQWTDDAPSNQNSIVQQLQQSLSPTSPDSASSARSLRSSHSLSALNDYQTPLPSEVIQPVLTARLRTRFYHVRYSIYRCYIYKVLHFPGEASAEDIENCVLCLKVCILSCNLLRSFFLTASQACCHWPIYMPPASDLKRLLPYHFCWSQT